MNTLEGPAVSSRKCIVSGEEHDKADLIRFVLGPDNEIVPDLQQKLPGRGVWLAADRKALERALAENRFAKAFKAKCRVDAGLPARLEDLIRREARQYLALANKAGLVVAGFFPTDAVQGYPPGAPTVMPSSASPTAAVHLLAALLIFLFLPIAAVISARRLRADGRTSAAIGSAACGIVMLAANAVTSAQPGTAGLVPGVAGLLQRVSLIAGFAWLAWFAVDRTRASAGREVAPEPGVR